MLQNSILLVGLGNIGKEYTFTRHNFGFLLIDAIIERFGANKLNSKVDGLLYSFSHSDKTIFLLKPTTFMNLSGKALLQLLSKQKFESIIVAHDDVEIDFGKVKIKFGGGNGGHNGLRSIDSSIGKDYWRLRLGVGKNDNMDLSDYVLSKFEQTEDFKLVINNLTTIIETLFTTDKIKIIDQYNAMQMNSKSQVS